MIAVFKRELNAYFKGIMGYLASAFLLIFAGIYTMAYNLSGYYANFEYVVSAISFIYLVAVPVLTMRSVAEEKRSKTDQLLYSLPISMTDVVIGKYLSMLVVLFVPVAIMGAYPMILSQFGNVSLKVAYGALFAYFMLGACLLSIGLFISSVTESQVASAVITLVVMLILYFMSSLATFVSTSQEGSMIALIGCAVIFALFVLILTRNVLISMLTLIFTSGGIYLFYLYDPSAFSGLFPKVMESLSVFSRFDTFIEGVFDVNAIVYYISMIAVFLFMSVQAMEKRRWSA
ncbi:MAG: ABC transporter permease subunit [Clostridia bacterium]|nr:ABC transporter [Clostridiales bacterium]MBQ6717219.1 ABC transporter permease subunit [Clostridia bacterium]